MRKSSRLKDRKELNINLILGSLRSLNPEFLACSKSRFFSHEGYKVKNIMHAIDEGKEDLVQALLLARVDPNKRSKLTGLTALQRATETANDVIVKLLLDSKSDPNLSSQKEEDDDKSPPPLMKAVEHRI
jgi:hypothetical protein